MADIRPFRGVRYNESLIEDWSAVLCPPYDIISLQQQEELYQKSQYNYIRIESGRELPQDTSGDNKYTRAAGVMQEWLEEGVFRTEGEPALYLHDHYFTRRGREYKRRSLIARVRLEEWDKMIVRPHEGTLTEARGDRLSLLFTMRANTSPVLAMYEDSGTQIASLLREQAKATPLVHTEKDEGESHDMWVITDTGAIDTVCRILVNRPLYIADGHHRYESALAYRNEQRALSQADSPDAPYNFVMMSLVDFTDPGLLILAPHRLVRGIPRSTVDELHTKLSSFFTIEESPRKGEGIRERIEDLLIHTSKVRIILFGLDPDTLDILTLNEPDAVRAMMPYFHSEYYRNLDVSIVDHVILENLLALSSEKEKTNLAFDYDMNDAIERVLRQEFQLALLVSPVRPDIIKSIADTGDKMPRKSTYFYPKTPSGLVINRLDTDQNPAIETHPRT